MSAHNAINWKGKTVNQLTVLGSDLHRSGNWVCKCTCGTIVSVGSMELKGGQKSCGCIRRRSPANKLDRTGNCYGRLTVLKPSIRKGYWKCVCNCGNLTEVLSTNLANYTSNNRGCKSCGHRKDITGEVRGLLTAIETESGAVKGRSPVWTFQCKCGGSIQGSVTQFNFGWLRSCGCHADTHCSWSSMIARCYSTSNNRYYCYGARGITVCTRWHEFENFVSDLGERPLGHTLSRKHAEKNYCKSNCCWELAVDNRPDTCKGNPTKAGLKRGALPR